MTLPDIMEEILSRSSQPLPIDQLTSQVEYSVWKGKSRGRRLAQLIVSEARRNPRQFTLQRRGQTLHIGLQGRSDRVIYMGGETDRAGKLKKDGQELVEGIAAATMPKEYAAYRVIKGVVKVVKDLTDDPNQSD